MGKLLIITIVLAFVLNCFAQNSQPCRLSYTIDSDCVTNCTIESVLTEAETDSRCASQDNLQVFITVTRELTGPGNTNITILPTSTIKSLSIGLSENIIITEGFFISSENALVELYVQGDNNNNNYIQVIGSTQTAIKFVSTDLKSKCTLSGLRFQDCVSEIAPAFYIDCAGSIMLTSVSVTDTQSYGDCGGGFLQIYPTTRFPADPTFSFHSATAGGNGGGLCLFGGSAGNLPPVYFECVSCTADGNGGSIYVQGPGNFEFTSFPAGSLSSLTRNNGSIMYAKDFDSIVLDNVHLSQQTPLFQTYQTQYGGLLYLESSVPSSTVHITRSSVTMSETVKYNGGIAYIKGVSNVIISESSFVNGMATYGIGGSFILDGVDNIEISATLFEANVASSGSALACIGGDNKVNVTEVLFQDNQSSSLDISHIDIYSDGSCTNPFWYSQAVCPQNFSCFSCADKNETICGSDGLFCFCYCGSDTCRAASVSPSVPPSPSISIVPSVSNVPSVSKVISPLPSKSTSSGMDPDSFETVKIVLIAVFGVGLLIFILMAVLVTYFLATKYRNSNNRSPIEPELSEDEE